jgi:hypothetical protein
VRTAYRVKTSALSTNARTAFSRQRKNKPRGLFLAKQVKIVILNVVEFVGKNKNSHFFQVERLDHISLHQNIEKDQN